MKKWQKFLTGSLTIAAMVTLVACGGKKPAEKPKPSKSDATAAASDKNSYTPISELKDSYDVIIIGQVVQV